MPLDLSLAEARRLALAAQGFNNRSKAATPLAVRRLIEQLGGPALSGIGFAMGLERIALLMEQQSDKPQPADAMDIFLAALGDKTLAPCAQLAHLLRKQGLRAAIDYSRRGLKAQLKRGQNIALSIFLQRFDEITDPLQRLPQYVGRAIPTEYIFTQHFRPDGEAICLRHHLVRSIELRGHLQLC